MKNHKGKIIAAVLVAVVLAVAFWFGGNAPQEAVPHEDTKASDTAISSNEAASLEKSKEKTPKEDKQADRSTEQNGKDTDQSTEPTETNKYHTEAVPQGKPEPVEPQNAEVTSKQHSCTLSVRCDTILANINSFDKEKLELVPKDGVIFAEKTVKFYEGESVFNLLVREMKKNKIHMEFENTPIYNSAYIEGIANIYEFDCGELSGWMYRVNGWFPNYGCSRYVLKDGDKVEWVYTCDLGADVGGDYGTKNGR